MLFCTVCMKRRSSKLFLLPNLFWWSCDSGQYTCTSKMGKLTITNITDKTIEIFINYLIVIVIICNKFNQSLL